MANGSAGLLDPWKEHDWKISNKEVWGRGMWVGFSEWTKNVKIFLSHVNIHQRVTLVEENFINQVDRMTHLVNTSKSLSPATPVIAQGTHEPSGHGDSGYTWAQQHRLPFTNTDLGSATVKCLVCQH